MSTEQNGGGIKMLLERNPAGLEVSDDIRMAGLVHRYHCWPVRQQTVAEHSWQICRILLSITTEDIANILIPHAIIHDIGEVAVGDLPFPLKKNNPELDLLFSKIEASSIHTLMEKWGIPPVIIHTWDGHLRWVFKVAEYIEMMEFGMEELVRGNEFGRRIFYRCRKILSEMITTFEAEEDWEKKTLISIDRYLETRFEMWGKYV